MATTTKASVTIRRHPFNSTVGQHLAASIDAGHVALYPEYLSADWRSEPIPKPGQPESSHHHFLVAFNHIQGGSANAQEEAIGCIALVTPPSGANDSFSQGHPPEKTGELRRTYVDPAHRGKGLAKKLLLAIETLARDELELERIRLITGCRQTDAIAMYQKCGYKELKSEGFGEGLDFSEEHKTVLRFMEKWI